MPPLSEYLNKEKLNNKLYIIMSELGLNIFHFNRNRIRQGKVLHKPSPQISKFVNMKEDHCA